jgi:glycosyltransferase involved in cell wall biosynthesis
MATMVEWERRSQLAAQPAALRAWRASMTRLTSNVERIALRGVDIVLVENEDALRHVRALGQPHVTKAPPGVDTTMFSPAPAGRRRDGHLLVVCRLGDPRKGLTRAVNAYRALLAMRPSAPDLVLAGRGTLAPATAALVRESGLAARVDVRCDVGTAELVQLYRDASVFLQTSFEEGLGVSVLEAMACGLPVVATETAGSRETVVPGVTGWLVAQDREAELPTALAHAVLRIIDDPDCGFGARGRGRCLQRFSTAVAVARFTDIYDGLLSGHMRSPAPATSS